MDRRAFLALIAFVLAARAADGDAKLVFATRRQTHPLFGYWEWIELRALDGAAVETATNKRREYALSPGPHEVTLRYAYGDENSSGLFGMLVVERLRERTFLKLEKKLAFEAQPGREYLVRSRVDTPGGAEPIDPKQVSYWIEDTATGEVVARTDPAPGH